LLDLINACNERCHFCPYYGTNGSMINNGGQRIESISKLELGVLEKMFDDLKKEDLFPQIKISGQGEGMLHPQFDQIIEIANQQGFEVRVITNGTKISDYLKTIEDNISTLVVSIHGNQSIHDTVVSRKGAYEAAIEGVKRLHKIDKRLPKVILAYVVTPSNIDCMKEHVNLCRTLGVEPRFQHDFIPNSNEAGFLDIYSLQEAVKAVRSMDQTIKFLPNLPASLFPTYYSPGSLVLNPYRCDRITQEIEIKANGEVYCCRSDVFGNINESSIMDIIFNRKRQAFLQVIKNETESAEGLDSEKCNRCCYQSDYTEGHK